MDYYSFTDLIADVWPTKWSSVQLAVSRRTGKVTYLQSFLRRTWWNGVKPFTNFSRNAVLFIQRPPQLPLTRVMSLVLSALYYKHICTNHIWFWCSKKAIRQTLHIDTSVQKRTFAFFKILRYRQLKFYHSFSTIRLVSRTNTAARNR